MIACWNEEYLERPKFGEIVQQLTQFIQVPNRLVPLAKQRYANDEIPSLPSFTWTLCSLRLQIRLRQPSRSA